MVSMKFYSRQNQSRVTVQWLPGAEGRDGELFGMKTKFCILTAVVVTRMCVFFKTH